jgi:hypothetical protein
MRVLRTRPIVAAAVAATMAVMWGVSAPMASDPSALILPAGISAAKARADIDAGDAFVDVLPSHGRELGVFGAVRTSIDGDRLVAWGRRIDRLLDGRYIKTVVRFSDPPRLHDLDSLVLGDGELEDLRRCRPGDCGLKLSAVEITRLRHTIGEAKAAWRSAAQQEFRRLVFERVQSYLAHGRHAFAPLADHKTPVHPAAESDLISLRIDGGPASSQVLTYLDTFPQSKADGRVESFLYWSQETLGAGKPIVSITQVAIARGNVPEATEAVVASKQIFASHYLFASLSIIAVTTPSAGGERYLLYTRHSRLDVFDGMLGGVVRRMIEGRIRTDAPAVLDTTRRRLERGDPPSQDALP